MGFFKKIIRALFGRGGDPVPEQPRVEAPSAEAAASGAAATDLHEAYRRLRIEEEAKFGAQPMAKKMRCDDAHPIYFAQYIKKVLDVQPEDLRSMRVLRLGDDAKKRDIQVREVHDPAYYNMVSDLLSPNPDSRQRAVLYVSCDRGGRTVDLVIHLQPRRSPSASDPYMSVKVDVLVPFATNQQPPFTTFFTYDAELPWRFTSTLNRQRVGAMQKDMRGLPLDPDERIALNKLDWHDCIMQGERRMALNDYASALVPLLKAYEHYTKEALLDQLPLHEKPNLAKTMQLIGKCYINRGLFAKGLYYIEALLNFNCGPIDGETSLLAHKCMQRLGDFRLPHSSLDLAQCSTWRLGRLGALLESCFDIVPDEVGSISVIADGRQLPRDSYPPSKLLSDDFISLLKRYRKVDIVADVEHDCILSARLSRMSANRANAVVMKSAKPGMPAFGPNMLSVDFAIDNEFRREDFQQLRDKASVKAIENEEMPELELAAVGSCFDAHYDYAAGIIAQRDNRFGDALYYYLKAYSGITSLLCEHGRQLDRFDMQMVGALCYKLGFTFSEFACYEMSISFLTKLQGSGNIEDNVEYINSLCNLKDIRAHKEVVKRIDALKQGPKLSEALKQDYWSFLQRRLCYTLIEKGRIAEAKKSLWPLLNSKYPPDRLFARDEWYYLISRFG